MIAANRDYKKEWFEKSQLDYFSAFIALWLSCNSWYNFQYPLKTDRQYINKIKEDTSNQNKIYAEFHNLFFQNDTKEQKSFFSNIEQLFYSLNRNPILSDNFKYPLSLERVLVNFDKKEDLNAYESIVLKNAKTKSGKLKKSVQGFDLGEIVLISDTQRIFAGIFEIIYQVRCTLVHGKLNPTEENMDIVKYCYFILYDLLKPFCE